jgi:hypothetical protein
VPRMLRVSALLLAAAMIAAACSGGSSSEPDASAIVDDDVVSTVEVDPLPAASSTTTLVDPPEASTTTSTIPSGPVAQMTGLAVDAELTHPALVIKIDNHNNARPQAGINAADIVYEEVVEGNITRLAAVFHSTNADPVGPVRSARTSDFDLLTDKNTPLFANSGGNTTTLRLLRDVDTISVNVNAQPNLYFRAGSPRFAPHNLMSRTEDLIAAGTEAGGTPPPMFGYRADGDALPDSAIAISGVDIDYGGRNVSYDWDEEAQGWKRTQDGSAHVDADGVQVAPPNVVVQVISYGRSPADPTSPEAILLGSGEVWVLTDGHLIAGTWTRNSKTDVTSYTLDDGSTIELTPGRTWVALPRVGQSSYRD